MRKWLPLPVPVTVALVEIGSASASNGARDNWFEGLNFELSSLRVYDGGPFKPEQWRFEITYKFLH